MQLYKQKCCWTTKNPRNRWSRQCHLREWDPYQSWSDNSPPCLTALIFCFIVDEIQTKLHFFSPPCCGFWSSACISCSTAALWGLPNPLGAEFGGGGAGWGEVRAVTSELPFSRALKMELHLMGSALEREEGSWELFLHPLLWFKSHFVEWKPPFGGRLRFWGALGVGIVSRSQ